MTLTFEFTIYILIINFVSGFFFVYDKRAARKNKSRIPEITLHTLELMGGVFTNILLMYTIRHKNRKFGYWVGTWIIFISWILCLIFLTNIYDKN
jgi:uncharacterized membrane protein YsdA (DUF1294 family)